MTDILKNFWVFEGLDGAGTTTQQKLLIQNLESRKIPCHKTQEPTDMETGKFLREVLGGKIRAEQSTIAYLFSADRDNHINNTENGILSHINKGEIVISDRYLFSSLAYQGIGFSYERVKLLNSFFPLPEIVFFIDTTVDSCIKRINSRGNSKEIYENYEYQQLVKQGYEKCFAELPSDCKLVRLNGENSIDSIANEIFSYVSNLQNSLPS